MHLNNQEIVKLLRSVAAALNLKKANIFQIRAYENAADSIEHLDVELEDLYREGKMGDVPGLGTSIQGYLGELFTKGKVSHFENLIKSFDPAVFEFLDIPGVGPKTAFELSNLGVKNKPDLLKKLKSGSLVSQGFSEKIAAKLINAVQEVSAKTERMLLPYAASQAQKILSYLKQSLDVIDVNPLGSLRRQVATIGDVDFAASSKNPEKVINYFVKMPGVTRIIDQGKNKANVVLASGIHLDLLVGKPDSYGALLQHFTGGKNHNIHLRTIAEKKGISLSEYGIKQKGVMVKTRTEEELYTYLGMQIPPPEIREDEGEIELALKHQLPKLVEISEIKGDIHIHSNFPFQSPSHGPGVDSIQVMVEKAIKLGFKFIGLSDHPPGFRSVSEKLLADEIEARSKMIEELRSKKSIRVLNGLEIDILPNGVLSVPDNVLKTLDYSIAGIHSSHRMGKDEMTNRILIGLENPYVDVLAHPSGRILNQRNSFEADWDKIFKFCAQNHKLLEINAFPDRLDLRDDLIKRAKSFGCKFVINTDSHEVSQMENMPYGVSVARRGWLGSEDVLNTWDWKKIAKWFNIAL